MDATEGEHGNVKASDANKRFFIIHKEKPVELTENCELVINFEYRSNPEKTGQERTWRDKRNSESVAVILASLEGMDSAKTYLRLLKVPAPTEKEKGRPLLAKYINQYTARNTMDYFIHKDLGGFLRRELDFYIKNEVMRLDDIENADAPAVETYLTKIKVLRNIANKLIDFLAQLENFQKKLWLKKKFVVETNYCITLDRIPEEFYPEIAANDKQRDEWVKLFAIDEIKRDLLNHGYSKPLTVEFLKADTNLVLDTGFFNDRFKNRLIASIEDFDNNCNGLLIQSENFHALNILKRKYKGRIKCHYADPPFNTNESTFLYKNEYKHSSWCTMVSNSICIAKSLMDDAGVLSIAIDDLELHNLGFICDNIYGVDGRLGILAVEMKPSGRTNDDFLATSHEYYLFYSQNPSNTEITFFELTEEQKAKYKEEDDEGAYKWRGFLRTGGYSTPEERPNSDYPIYYNKDSGDISLEKHNDWNEILPIDSEGRKRVWRKTPPSFIKHLKANEIQIIESRSGELKVQIIDRIKSGTRPKSVWVGSQYDASSHGTKLLKAIFGEAGTFSFPKSVYSAHDVVYITTDEDQEAFVLDSFAGSGTTGHAVLMLNREDEGNRRYILIEMGNYFNTVLKPRMSKIIYSEKWESGKPKSHDKGVSHCFKYFRLESYEDTLNNLYFDENQNQTQAIESHASFKEDYMLNYLLDVETRGSQSLLSIDAFNDPTSYKLRVKKPESDEYTIKNVDLIETFNYLIGLRVNHIAIPQKYNAEFKRNPDPELPHDQNTRLVVDGEIQQDDDGPWWFCSVKGWVPKDPSNPNNGQRENVLIIWRKLTGDVEEDNLMLDEWFQKTWENIHELEFDIIYVNGSSNLQNLALPEDTWKVRLLEEEFMKCMWDVENV